MQRLDGTSVAVIGGGFGGLSTACYLADAGADVTVLEKNEQLGVDRSPEDYYPLQRLDPHYRIFFKDGDRVDMKPDLEANVETFESYEAGAGEALRDYLGVSETHYEVAMEKFVYEDRPRLRDWVDLDVMRAAPIGLRLVGTMDDYVSNYFENPKLQQIMQYTLVFLGGSPKNTPALYNMMSHVDFNLGVYYPAGGIGAVVDGLVDLGTELGVEYRTNAEVREIISRKRGFELELAAASADLPAPEAPAAADGGVHTETGDRLRFDRVVSDADYAHTEGELLPEHLRGYSESYWESKTYAPSAFLMYLGVEGDVDPLAHHTLVLPTDWDPHFEQIFDRPAWPDDPAYYLCVPSATDDAVAPEAHSNLFVLVPVAPGLDDSEATREAYRGKILADIAEHTGVDLRDRIVFEERFSVSEFAERYHSMRGTALGLAHTLTQTALLRPDRRSKEVPGLYFTGSYTTPGIGVPMCLIAGQHTADAVIEDAP
ncbi:phytoene desaturase [Halobacteriales archaeon QS_5_70_15]|nr:MAG: phytoene desaturase [Halobacteriales archaeon QS_5_70_15]